MGILKYWHWQMHACWWANQYMKRPFWTILKYCRSKTSHLHRRSMPILWLFVNAMKSVYNWKVYCGSRDLPCVWSVNGIEHLQPVLEVVFEFGFTVYHNAIWNQELLISHRPTPFHASFQKRVQHNRGEEGTDRVPPDACVEYEIRLLKAPGPHWERPVWKQVAGWVMKITSLNQIAFLMKLPRTCIVAPFLKDSWHTAWCFSRDVTRHWNWNKQNCVAPTVGDTQNHQNRIIVTMETHVFSG